MGSYIHVGLVAEVSISTADLESSGISNEELDPWLRDNCVSQDLHEQRIDQGQRVWTLKPDLLGPPLVTFLQEQDRIARSDLPRREELYQRLRGLDSWRAVLDLADRNEHYDFYLWPERDYLGPRWSTPQPRVDTTLLVYLMEGKALLECWTTLFRYLEHMVHLQADQFPLARAVKLAVG